MLPFETNRFLFNQQEFETYFPAYVVQQMVSSAHPSSTVKPPSGFFFLPPARDLPIAFCARLSLSFPVLFSAVPLYSLPLRAPDRRPGPATIRSEHLQLNWFSDGGICSNFPVHFFDRWLPRRPTFGITLTALPAESFLKGGRVSSDYLAMSRPSGQIGIIKPAEIPRCGSRVASPT